MSEHFVRQYGDCAMAAAYHELAVQLQDRGQILSDRIPLPPGEITLQDHQIDLETHLQIGEHLYSTINEKQRKVVDYVFKQTPHSDYNCMFIDGPGGTGKTNLYSSLYNLLVGRGKSVICVAWSGIAAMLLPNGRTVHSTFKLPLKIVGGSISSNMKPNSRDASKVRNISFIICGEAPMASKQELEAIAILLLEINRNKFALRR